VHISDVSSGSSLKITSQEAFAHREYERFSRSVSIFMAVKGRTAQFSDGACQIHPMKQMLSMIRARKIMSVAVLDPERPFQGSTNSNAETIFDWPMKISELVPGLKHHI
jgi:hypothetical protein